MKTILWPISLRSYGKYDRPQFCPQERKLVALEFEQCGSWEQALMNEVGEAIVHDGYFPRPLKTRRRVVRVIDRGITRKCPTPKIPELVGPNHLEELGCREQPARTIRFDKLPARKYECRRDDNCLNCRRDSADITPGHA